MINSIKSGKSSRSKNDVWDSSKLKTIIRDIPDFPKKGILFRDITPLLQNAEAFQNAIDVIARYLESKRVSFLLGIESRGFIFGSALAYKMGVGFAPIRKQGKLPFRTQKMSYSLEYGESVIELHEDAFPKGTRVAIVDDLLATGGTAEAAAKLAEKIGGQVVTMVFLIELLFLKGREKLSGYDIFSLVQY